MIKKSWWAKKLLTHNILHMYSIFVINICCLGMFCNNLISYRYKWQKTNLKHPYAVWVRNVVASTLQNLYMLPIRVSGVYSVLVGVGPVDLVRAEVDGDPVRPVNSVSRDDRLIVCAVHPGSYNSGVTGWPISPVHVPTTDTNMQLTAVNLKGSFYKIHMY